MIRGGFRNIGFQTFYVSREKSNCPFIPEIIKVFKNLKELEIIGEKASLVFSHRYGKRILINSEVEDLSNIKHEELIEIVDYDPLKNNLLILGPGEPRLEIPVHWMIQHARCEINVIIQLNEKSLVEKISDKVTTTQHIFPVGSIEQIKDVLKNLSNSKIVVVKNQSVIFVGKSLEEVKNLIIKTVGELK
jgi:hypothetical protein